MECSQNIRRVFPDNALTGRYDLAMAQAGGKVHVVRVSKTGYVDKQGRRRDYSSAYLRRTYREAGKVKNETVANLSALPGPAGRARDLALALIISRVVKPGSKLSTLTWWADTALGADLGAAGASTDDIYAAMDWLEGRQDEIEAELARRD